MPLRRIQRSKWIGALVAVVVLSQAFERWRAFSQAPTALTYAGILLAVTCLLLLLAFLAVTVYAEEKAKGRISRSRPFLDRWSERFFPSQDANHVQ
jgi:putative copper export protein